MRSSVCTARSTGETRLRVLEPSHVAMGSSLHPMAGREEVDLGAFLYTRETADPALAFRARMLAPGVGEDPATGSAAAAFAGVVMAFDRPSDGEHLLRIGQGYEMGRPSVIELGLTVRDRALSSASIGGAAVVVAEGTLFLP